MPSSTANLSHLVKTAIIVRRVPSSTTPCHTLPVIVLGLHACIQQAAMGNVHTIA